MKLTVRQLKTISSKISNGSPVWALLTANEYLTKDHPCLNVLQLRAKEQFVKRTEHYSAIHELLTKISNGARLQEFSSQEQAILKNIDQQAIAKEKNQREHAISKTAFQERLVTRRANTYRREPVRFLSNERRTISAVKLQLVKNGR